MQYFHSAPEVLTLCEQRPEHTGSHVVVTAGTHDLTVADIHLISNPNGWLNDKVFISHQ